MTSLGVMSIPAPRAKIIVIKVRRSSGSGSGCSLINFAVEFASPTSTKVAGEEEEDNDDGNNANNRENSGQCAFVVKEAKEKNQSVTVLGK